MQNQLSQTLLSIYKASLDPGSWDECMDDCVEFTGSKSSTIQSIDVSNSEPTYNITNCSDVIRRIGPSALGHYSKVLMQYENVAWQALCSRPRHTLLADDEVWSEADSILRTRDDYVFLLEHLGTLRRLGVKLHDNLTWIDAVAFQFDSSLKQIPDSCKSRIQQLLPHLSKSTEIAHNFHILKKHYDAVLTALDHVAVGLVVADSDLNIIVKNKEADRIFDMRDGLMLSNSHQIHCTDVDKNELINNAIRECASTANGAGITAEFVISLSKRSAADKYIVEVAPLCDSSDELGQKLKGALITIVDTRNIKSVPTKKLSLSYDLSKAESSVCELLVQGFSNKEISERRDVGSETIKSQINSIFRKTNSKKRSELIRLALQINPPIALPGE